VAANQPDARLIFMPGPLSGFKVLDLSAVVSGPLTGGLLADQGAEVIKVERPSGDIQRHVGSSRNGFSGFFHVLNRGKRSLALDLGRAEAAPIVERLAGWADVVIQNFRPGVADRIGVGYDHLAAINPQLVYLSISGFGQTGPKAGERAYDPIIQFYSGIAAVQGRIHLEHPQQPEQVNMLILDKLTAYTGCQAITAALLARTRTGTGQHIELSMLDTAIAFLWADAAADLILQGDGVDQRPPIGASGNVAEYADGWGATMTLSDDEFTGMCTVYGLRHIAEDPRFARLEARQRNRPALAEIMRTEVAAAARKMTISEASERMRAHDVPFARARRLDELAGEPQVDHNGMFRSFAHPVAGPMRDARPAPRFLGTPAEPGAPAPLTGQHSRAILTEHGFGGQVDAWLASGLVAEPKEHR
jgi:crotonobetainyl-CoA:carnitine CoA-transferase CaiB-like acyl-CoA transferase